MTKTPILIAGAGPTGLVLALSLARRGTPFRLITAAKEPGRQSRAMAVHARTLEFYRQFGFADAVVAAGVKAKTLHLRETGKDGASREVTRFEMKDLADGATPYPFVLTFPQDDHERFLVGELKKLGIEVEWDAKLTGFTQDADGVRATIAHGDGRTEEAAFDYLCGADGGHSQVRQSAGIAFAGGAYEQHFYVADVKIEGGPDPDFWIDLGPRLLALMLPVRSSGMQRLIGLVPPELNDREDLGFEDIRGHVEPLLEVKVTEVNWFSRYKVHHRVAEQFRKGRAFLLGDAGHVHSPVGGQGMNTGIGDAVNLGWKLAQAAGGRADASLLDTYELERIAFAQHLVATTDRAFVPLVAGGWGGAFTRGILAPLAFAIVTRFQATRHAAFSTLSQTRIGYGGSPLSEGRAGGLEGGERLPWTGEKGEDNFAPLASLDWQMHVYGEPDPELAATCAELSLPLHAFGWSDAATAAGLERDAAYLIRPDGHVALAAQRDPAAKLRAYADRFKLRFQAAQTRQSGRSQASHREA